MVTRQRKRWISVVMAATIPLAVVIGLVIAFWDTICWDVRWDRCPLTKPFALGAWYVPGGLQTGEASEPITWQEIQALQEGVEEDSSPEYPHKSIYLNDYTVGQLIRFMQKNKLAVIGEGVSCGVTEDPDTVIACLRFVELETPAAKPVTIDTTANATPGRELKVQDLADNMNRAREWFSPLNPKTQKQLLAFMEKNQLYIRPGTYGYDPSWPLERVLGELSFYSLDEDLRYTFDNTLWQDEDDTSYSDCACREG